MHRRRPADRLLVLAVTLLTLAGGGADAAPATGDASAGEIVIRARSARLDQVAGVGIYEGDAELTQGLRRLRADRIRIELENGEPVRIEATGSPARLSEGDTLDARGERMVYDVAAEQVHLSGSARVDHQGRVFEGAELNYHMATGQVDARGGDEGGRVRMVIPAEDVEKNR